MLLLADNPATQTWFVGEFVPEVLDLVLKTWDKFVRYSDVRLEQRITNLFSDALEAAYLEEGKSWFVFPDVKRNHPKTGKELARHDIRFYHRDIQGQKLYFIFECKRLNVQRAERIVPNTSGYTAGMFRFVTRQYSEEHPCGGMIGYVMDGNVRMASGLTKSRIQKQHALLQMKAGDNCCTSSSMPNHKYNCETRHLRKNGPFVLYHLFLRVKPIKPKRIR